LIAGGLVRAWMLWNRPSSAPGRAGTGVSWRSAGPRPPGAWSWWCRCVLSPVSGPW